MQSFGVVNLRSFGSDDGCVELNNLTIFLGSNSSGKSSLIRFLPLLKQSLERRTTGPILWYGRLVDFGDYKSSIHRGAKGGDIRYELAFDKEDLPKIQTFGRHRLRFGENDFKIRCKVDLAGKSRGEAAMISSYHIEIFDHNIIIRFNNKKRVDSIEINGKIWEGPLEYRCMIDDVVPKILPPIFSEVSQKTEDSQFFRFLGNYLKMQDANSKIKEIYNSFALANSKDIFDGVFKRSESISPTWHRSIVQWEHFSPQFKELVSLYLFEIVSDLTVVIYEMVRRELANVTYIAPLRANAERYYRFQDLAIDEIDSKGQNTPMYLYNMSASEKKEFQRWCKEKFGFYFNTQLSNGQITVDVGGLDSGNEMYNIIDMGFGFSQILPIIAQIWSKIAANNYSSHRVRDRMASSIIIIEQPELHLHPKMQAKFAELIAALAASEPSVKFLVETHSQTIMNKLGNLVYKNQPLADLISVYLFRKEDLRTSTIKTGYDDEGILKEWPTNFLESY